MLVAHNVKTLREKLGWSQQELIDRSGVSNVKMIESGKRYPRPASQKKLASALSTPVWRLHVGRQGDDVPVALQQLKQSPIGASITGEEYEYLLALPSMLGRRMSYEAYWKALEMLRLTTPDPESVGLGGDEE